MDSDHWHFFESLDWGFHQPVGTKFMVLQLVAALLILAIYIPLARAARTGKPPSGWLWNCFEVLLTFIRDEVAKPNIGAGHHDDHGHDKDGHDIHHREHPRDEPHALAQYRHPADKYVPYLWTLFLFVLFSNLLGMIPFLGSATGSFTVTLSLAIVTFIYLHGSAMFKLGVGGYFHSYVPAVDAPILMKAFLVPMIVVIEVVGAFIKCGVLAVRLFANMFAGHMVLAFIMAFIVMAKNTGWYLFWPISVGSAAMVIGLSLLELFVAFLQAFVFTFLTAIFLGAQLNPEH
jgi:F-type H+-transporting ATPase subunit a